MKKHEERRNVKQVRVKDEERRVLIEETKTRVDSPMAVLMVLFTL